MEKVTRERFRELSRKLRREGATGPCLVWPDSSARMPRTGDQPWRLWSPRAGGMYAMPDDISLGKIRIPDDEARKRISSWIWERNAVFDTLDPGEDAEIPELKPAIIAEVCRRRPLSIEQRADKGLHAIGRPPGLLGPPRSHLNKHMLFSAATECGRNDKEKIWLLEELERVGLLRNLRRRNPGDGVPEYILTLKGLHRLEIGGKVLASNTVFVAMSFDEEVGQVYDRGIAPALGSAGYKPVRIDRNGRSNGIDDEIIAEIRRARFLVCDLTNGVPECPDSGLDRTAVSRWRFLYEAGFAHGLGKHVIWTCRKDLVEHVDFGLRQRDIISWEAGQERILRRILDTRVRAVIA